MRLQRPCRFIPAPAGNSRAVTEKRGGSSVHPRACGEQCEYRDIMSALGGSSPRLRGTGLSVCQLGDSCRFIPAPAGNRDVSAGLCPNQAVHPRACGEQNNLYNYTVQTDGSSPRLRGTVWFRDLGIWFVRFIPAPAGNRFGGRTRNSPAAVHPRACGEQSQPCSNQR